MTKLTQEEVQRRRELTEKLQKGTLTPEEAQELIEILEKEKKIAEEERDFAALVAIFLLLALIAMYLNKKQ
ncbi:hypothetical protein APY94_02880 [Thermococcus celericrescens]|uniref:Uncharacterized protein n=1 Tax=Thermococcus celericrescens TaxID=227598 RepID=A0A117IU26_9EURY|nr:hypothetical protein [Thermococcus celericrescens]KUH34234.1 hypothetical protein APY94_02880 [Thermococcus celericrescens]